MAATQRAWPYARAPTVHDLAVSSVAAWREDSAKQVALGQTLLHLLRRGHLSRTTRDRLGASMQVHAGRTRGLPLPLD